LIQEWKFYGQKSGWILKTLRKKRNLFFFIPLEDSFQVSFVYGEKAVVVVEKSDLPQELITELKNAKNTQKEGACELMAKILPMSSISRSWWR